MVEKTNQVQNFLTLAIVDNLALKLIFFVHLQSFLQEYLQTMEKTNIFRLYPRAYTKCLSLVAPFSPDASGWSDVVSDLAARR